ncbi:MAG: tetratricopeptide repeat protein [Anaerolineae bacterium]|nr:tetratricopeptide repeat protein [Anaerolineae bacterium]
MAAEALVLIDELLGAGDLKRAEVQIAKLMRAELDPATQVQTYLLRARARLLGARPEDALDDLNVARTLTKDPKRQVQIDVLAADAWFARFELASVGFADRAHALRAYETYRQIVSDHPDDDQLGWVYYQMGRVCLTDGRTDEAIACFESALMAPSPMPTLTAFCFERLGFAHFYELRHPRKARAFLEKAVFTYPTSADPVWLARVQTLRSRVLRELGDVPAALEAAEQAIAIAQESDESRMALADALLTAGELMAQVGGRDRDVITYLQQFLQTARKPLGIDVTWSRVYEMLGGAYFNLGQHGAAGAAYEHALQYNPYHPWEIGLHYQIARSYYQAEAYDKAIGAVDTLLNAALKDQQTISDYRIFDILGSAHFALKHYVAAREAYDQALKLAPTNASDLDKIKRYHQFAAELSARA